LHFWIICISGKELHIRRGSSWFSMGKSGTVVYCQLPSRRTSYPLFRIEVFQASQAERRVERRFRNEGIGIPEEKPINPINK
jgi:hypothetical protein